MIWRADLGDSCCVSVSILCWRLPDGPHHPELETPHLITRNIPGKTSPSQSVASKFKCRLILMGASGTIVLYFPKRIPLTTKSLLISCFSCPPSLWQTVNFTDRLSDIKREWSIVKHWSVKSKPLFHLYVCGRRLSIDTSRRAEGEEKWSPLTFLEGQIGRRKMDRRTEQRGSKGGIQR